MLRDLGVAEVVTGANGNAALVAFDRMRPAPDVVVCDLNMPDGDGFQFMEKLGTRGFAGGVVLISGLDPRILNSAALMAKFHNLKILETLKKPVDKSSLRMALAKLN
jgi:CheY-like chemotaxis protein